MNQYIRNMYKYKDLFIELVIKDIKIKYRSSVLGVLWSMLNPLLMTIVLTFIFMELFKSDIEHFAAYVFIGRMMFQFFAEATTFAMNSIVDNAALIRKVYVPKYFFPLSRVVSSLITSLLSVIPLILTMIVTGLPFSWGNLLFIIPLLYLLVISVGISLLLASINVFFKDVAHFYSIIVSILTFMTPIFYPASIIPDEYMALVLSNPLYPVVEMFRDAVLYGTGTSMLNHTLSIVYMVVYGGVGLAVFYKTQDRFIYHV